MSFVKYVAIPLYYFDLLKGASPKASEIKEEISEPVQVQIVDSAEKKEVVNSTALSVPPAEKAVVKRKRQTLSNRVNKPPPGIRDKQTGWIYP